MVGAQWFNQQEDNHIEEIYGCVTTGEDWQFLKLTGKTDLISTPRYYLSELQQVLWPFQHVIDIHKIACDGKLVCH
jgi:hypothetical protein